MSKLPQTFAAEPNLLPQQADTAQPGSALPYVDLHIKPGDRYVQALPPGSGDACLIGQIAQAAHPERRLVVVLCTEPHDAQRLYEEIKLFKPHLSIHQLPDWETLAYDAFSPHEDLISERLASLYGLMQGQIDVLTLTVTCALHCLAPLEFLAAYTFQFRQNDQLNPEQLRNQLILANYQAVTQVMAPGEFCIRGGLIDLFPMGSALPYRIDLLDDTIESIRGFDIDTQRSLYSVKEIRLLPGREFPMDEPARLKFRQRFREQFEGDPSRAMPYKDIGNGIAFAGVEYYLPLFFEKTATLFDYLKPNTQLILHGNADKVIQQFTQDTENRWKFLQHDIERPLLPPHSLFLNSEQFFTACKRFSRLILNGSGSYPGFGLPPEVSIQRKAEDPLALLRQFINSTQLRILICAESAGRRETLAGMFAEFGLHPKPVSNIDEFIAASEPLMLGIAPLSMGFSAGNLLFLTETELYRDQSVRRRHKTKGRERQNNIDTMVKDLAELRPGDPIVHVQHGIGRYQGLLSMDIGEGEMEFLHLSYAQDSTLYVPVSQLHLISRYSGADPENAPLHVLGSGHWEKLRKRAAQQARDAAAELLNLYARRAVRQGFAFKLPLREYETFADGFGFEETVDQAAAIEAVLQDMTSGKPMDRLVCGDVGFGKTEVALRAAFMAVANSKQVAILCPTTLLAEQHYQTFSDRFADMAVNLAELSRFKTAKEIQASIEAINQGKIDIVIGTHKLLSPAVKFSQLGLVIIDEEHRFGVRQKEALKALRAEVDVLTLTATPIPRTLGMSLEGIRDFSVIATAPQKRLAIKTFVRKENYSTIREALVRELKRGGQVYFLHNEVDTIQNRRAMLEQLLPEARIAVAHGQMPERELEHIMHGFYHQKYNILLCTTIIETGIDVPSANTIIIHRADRFGLGQLHQLRGRVGRSHHQAYAYLMIPGEDAITNNAKKRLEAIQMMEELGSGFYLAMHDLEIRGAGEVLGDSQSGNIQEVGFQMYIDMLNQAVRSLKAGKEPDISEPLAVTTEINLHTPALLPADYCGDVHERLSIYKRLASTETIDAIQDIQEELIDRFGSLPDAAKALIEVHKLRLTASSVGILKIDASENQALFHFMKNPPIDPMRILQMVQKDKRMRLSGPDKLRLELNTADLKLRIEAIRNTLRALV